MENKGVKNSIWELLKFVLIAGIIIIPFRIYIAQPFIVSGSSMDPTFHNGDYLIVDQISYRFEKPNRDDVIIFKYPKNPSEYFIKRVIGLPEETVVIENGTITIKNSEFPEGFVLNEDYVVFEKFDSMQITLRSDEYFVMGDNRAASSDSRVWGPLNESFIIGRPFARLLPPQNISLFPGVNN